MDAETARKQQKIEWALSAPGWLAHRDELEGRGHGVMTPRLLGRLGLTRGDRVLDLACGIGNPSGEIARVVGDEGEVLGLDLSPEMIDGARRWAADRGLTNVSFEAVENEHELGVTPGSFDAACCRVGLQYLPEPAAALRSLHTALRPGGRLAVCTLGSAERCMAFTISSAVIDRYAPPRPAAGEAPGPVSLSDAARLKELVESAGFREVSVETFETVLIETDSAVAAWELFEETMGPLMRLAESLTADRRAALHEDGVRAMRHRFPSGPVHLTGQVLLAAGTTPAS